MATADAGPVSRTAKEYPRALTAVLTVVGYALVIGTLYVGLPIYPTISLETVNLLSHAIAAINTATVVLLLAGYRFIRAGDVRRHRAAMLGAFGLILLFLVLYLLKTGGGGQKEIIAPDGATIAYLAMLGIHILLSVLAVPLVLYNITIGLTHSQEEMRGTAHARVGRWAVGIWSVSLTLGIAAYVLLNHVYTYEFVRLLVRVPAPF
jgi:putative membrane protein